MEKDTVPGYLVLTLFSSLQIEPTALVILNLAQGWGKPSGCTHSFKWECRHSRNTIRMVMIGVYEKEQGYSKSWTFLIWRQLTVRGQVSLSLPTTTSPHRQWRHPLMQLRTKRAMLNSAVCTSALTSYSMVHPWLTKSWTFSNLRKKERGKEREGDGSRGGAGLYLIRDAFNGLAHCKLITPGFLKLLFYIRSIQPCSIYFTDRPFWGQTSI